MAVGGMGVLEVVVEVEGDFGAGVADAAVEDFIQGVPPPAGAVWLAVMGGELAGEVCGGATGGVGEVVTEAGEEAVGEGGVWGVGHGWRISGRSA